MGAPGREKAALGAAARALRSSWGEGSSKRCHRAPPEDGEEAITVLWTIFVVLLVLWAVGLVSSYTLGGFIHLLLLVAIAVVLIRIIQGRRPV